MFLLALASKRTGVRIHAVCVLSNHYHAVVTDPHGVISEFYHYLHEFSAKVLNTKRGRWENMWSITETSRVRLEDDKAVEDKLEYTLCNPVSSLLVAFAEKWPGLRMWWNKGPITVARPNVFFREFGAVPETVTLELVPPPHLAELPDKGVEHMTECLATREKALRKEARDTGKRFVGVRNIAKQKYWECPTSFGKRRGLRPRVATRDRWRRVEAIGRDRQFLAEYRDVRKQWLAGVRDVLWPAGTYLMRVLHGVCCHPPPT